MPTHPAVNIDHFLGNIITSYESRIQNIQTAFQSSENITEFSHSLFDNVHQSLNELKKERDNLSSKLCENLAKKGSLRKKDYNTMMSGIIQVMEEKEKEAESQFLGFIEAQKETAQSLKNSLLGIKDITSQDTSEKISDIKKQLTQISRLQEQRKESVIKTFLGFQEMHNRIMACLENLLEKGDLILAKDIKKVKEQIIQDFN
jgi:DNA anti-recombination protein RmuC